MTDTVELEQLPVHALRSALKDKGIKFKPTDKKADLIAMLEAGESKHDKKVVKKAPTMKDHVKPKAIPVVPKEIRGQLEQLAEQGLKWTIDENVGVINFMRDIPTCANLDQPALNILSTAREAFGKQKPRILNDYR